MFASSTLTAVNSSAPLASPTMTRSTFAISGKSFVPAPKPCAEMSIGGKAPKPAESAAINAAPVGVVNSVSGPRA